MQFSEKYYSHKKFVKMVVFPNCKINLGLNVIEKRPDGFHNISTVFYPVNWCDALEVVEGGSEPFNLVLSGLSVDGNTKDNILYKAWKLIISEQKLPHITIYLHKAIPMGAGLGGGSSDAAFLLKLLNTKFQIGFTSEILENFASQLGSDCSFFVKNTPVTGRGKGDEFEPLELNLSSYYLLVVYPGIHSNTKDAYSGIVPKNPERNIKDILRNEPLQKWKDYLVNDFESSIFRKYSEIEKLKKQLYDQGAVYASMSGSGSAVFGIFEEKPFVNFPANYLFYLQEPVKN